MDIHRSRFVQFPASPINAISFSRTSDKGLSDPKAALKLAIGRGNGDIEIWSAAKGDWVQETVFVGGENKSIEGLVWTQEPDDADYEGKPIVGDLRLFSIGSTAAVTEWNLGTGQPLRASTGNFSEVWCIAAQPRWKAIKGAKVSEDEFKGQNLVAGCGDGTLAILSTSDNDLTFQRFLARSGSRKTRCMSVTWQNRDRIVAGFSDSNIRIYDSRNGSLLRNMSLGAGIPGAPKDTLVWRLKCLPNGDIVSADSNGEVRFWDGRSYSLIQRVSGHESDCLEIVTSSDGQAVFSGGIDGRIATYKLGGKEGEKRRWAKTSHRKMHEGDIKAMAVYDSKTMSVVVSGGLDAAPTIIPLRAYSKELHRKVPALPQAPPCVSAPGQRLLVSWWDQTVSIWRIGKQQLDNFVPEDRTKKLVAKIAIKGGEGISSVAISHDGRILSVATPASIKVFQLRSARGDDDDRLRVRTLDVPSEFSKTGAKLVEVSPDGHWLSAVRPDNEVTVARLSSSPSDSQQVEILSEVIELDRPNRKGLHQTGLNKYDRTIHRMTFSPDSCVLVAGDLSGYVDSWVLLGHYDSTAPAMDKAARDSPNGSHAGSDSDSDSDSDDEDTLTVFYGQHWASVSPSSQLPKLDSAPLILSFRPTAHAVPAQGNPGIHPTRSNPHAHSHAKPTLHSRLFVMTQHHNIHEFDILTGKLTDWSRRNPSSVLPPELKTIKDRAMSVVWDSTDRSRQRLWIHGSSWLSMLDVSQDFDLPAPVDAETDVDDSVSDPEAPIVIAKDKKRKRSDAQKWSLREDRKRIKGLSGAGDRIHALERGGGASTARRFNGDDEEEDFNLDATVVRSLSDDEMETDDAVGPLRRDERDRKAEGRRRRKWWCTYKYRPILGVVPIADTEEGEPVEVVLIERPPWELSQVRALGGDY